MGLQPSDIMKIKLKEMGMDMEKCVPGQYSHLLCPAVSCVICVKFMLVAWVLICSLCFLWMKVFYAMSCGRFV